MDNYKGCWVSESDTLLDSISLTLWTMSSMFLERWLECSSISLNTRSSCSCKAADRFRSRCNSAVNSRILTSFSSCTEKTRQENGKRRVIHRTSWQTEKMMVENWNNARKPHLSNSNVMQYMHFRWAYEIVKQNNSCLTK